MIDKEFSRFDIIIYLTLAVVFYYIAIHSLKIISLTQWDPLNDTDMHGRLNTIGLGDGLSTV